MGTLSFHFEWNVPEAERQLRRAIELNPNYYRAHSYCSIMLVQLGRDEAHEQFREARTLDPLSAFNAAVCWHVSYRAREYDETIKVCPAALEMEPAIACAYYGLILSFEQRGEYAKAIEQRVLSIQPGDPDVEQRKRAADRCIWVTEPEPSIRRKKLTNHTIHLLFPGLSARRNLIPSIPNCHQKIVRDRDLTLPS